MQSRVKTWTDTSFLACECMFILHAGRQSTITWEYVKVQSSVAAVEQHASLLRENWEEHATRECLQSP